MKKPFVVIIICLILFVIGFAGCTNQNNQNLNFVVIAPISVTEGDDFEVTISVDGVPIDNVEVTFNKITKSTNSDGKVNFTAPQISADRNFNITVQKEGYSENISYILIVNFPALQVVTMGDIFLPDEQISVVVADDWGELITGATVTLDGQTNTTVLGSTTLTAPLKPGNYTITAERSGFRSATTTIKVE